MAVRLIIGKMATRAGWIRLLAIVFCLLVPQVALPIGMVASLDQHGRTTETFRPVIPEVGLSLAFLEAPLLKMGKVGPQAETEINYHTGYVQIRSYYLNRKLTAPLALEIRRFNALRNEGRTTTQWRDNIRLSLGKAQFQKHGSGLQWEIIKVPKSVRAILGEGGVGLQVNGYRRIEFSGTSRWDGGVKNVGGYRQSKFPSLDMKQVSRFTIKGNIGSKIYVTVDQDSKRESDLANRIQIRYKGDEDDVLQTVELGNTTLNLPNSRFVGYSQQIQGLFGVKATAKLGDLGLTMITSQEKGSTERTRFTAGAKQNVVYIRDYQYLARTYYDIGYFGPQSPNAGYQPDLDSIVEFRLFGQGIPQNNDRFARIYIDPHDTTAYAGEYVGAHVHELTLDEDYFLEPNQFWIRMDRLIRQNDLLACFMVVNTSSGPDTVGTLRGDTLVLRLIKPSVFSDKSSTWDYEWRHVYNLGARNLDYDEFQVEILKGPPNSESQASNLNQQGTIRYLQLFGLDSTGATPGQPDGFVDRREDILDLYRGHLAFRNRTPFAPGDLVYGPNTPPGTRLNPQVDSIYTMTNQTTLNQFSQYYLKITTSRRLSTYSLGRVNILEGSETVTLNGQRLIKGADYQIDYELGQITFLKPEVSEDPNADLTVDFEYAPFISADKKSLFGARAEYAPSQNFQLGSSFLYKGQKSTDRQPKLGQEKSRNVIGEMDFSFAANPRWMTKLADAVPLVKVGPSTGSRLSLSGELARSMPNPNTEGKVYLDDFEGTKLSTELGRDRQYWTQCTPPEGISGATRSRINWYNPIYEFDVRSIYNRDIGQERQEAKIRVLVLRPRPDSATSWSGIMRALPLGMNDQSRAQFLEIRLGTYGEVQGNLHLDLGEISEDINGDRALNEEDRNKNGILNEDEDTGLDGVFSANELGYDPATNPDPNGDDWHYDDQNNYDHINGTESNQANGDPRGNRPDTEDIDGNGNLDLKNAYYSFRVDLVNSEYLVMGSERRSGMMQSGKELVFRTYRVPLWGGPDVTVAGDPTPSLTRYARVWFDNMTEQAEVIVAAFEVVENRWQPQPVAGEDTLATDKHIRGEVINTEENQNYYPPPGVSGYYDRQTQRREKEQSLLVRFENFEIGDTGWVVKTLNQVEDHTGYRFLRMAVHGDTAITRDTGVVSFIFRMGNSPSDYYEHRFDLDTGWSPQNEVVFDVDQLTPLKRIGIEVDVGGQKERWSADSAYKVRGNPTLTQMRYFAIGLTYKEGASSRLSGDVWCDEMRLDGVRRDQGTAARLSLTAEFADLFGVALNSEYQTYSFRGLAAASSGSGQGVNLLNGATQTRHDAGTHLSLGKFLPDSWRAQLPLSVRYTKDVSVPKLETGSDVVLTPELQERETTTNISHSVQFSGSLAPETKHWLAKMTIKAFSAQGSVTRQQTWSPRVSGESENYTASGRYNLSFQNLWPISPLIWTRYMFLPKRVWATQLRLLPKSFQANGSIQRTRGESTNALGFPVFNYTRRFRGQSDLSFEPFSVLDVGYGFTTERNLYDPKLIRFSLNPRDLRFGRETKFTQKMDARYTPPFFKFLGPSLSYGANYNEDSDPQRYSDGTRSVGVSSRLTATGSVNFKQLLGVKGGGGGRGKSSATEKTKEKSKEKQGQGQQKEEGQKEPQQQDSGQKDKKKGNGNGNGGEDPPGGQMPSDSVKTQEPAAQGPAKAEKSSKTEKAAAGKSGFRPHAPFLWILRLATGPFEPIRLSYSHDETRSLYRLLGRPSFSYRLGLASTSDVPKSKTSGTGSNRDSETSGDAYSLNSAVNVLSLLKVTTSYDYSRSTSLTTTSSRRTARTFPKLSTALGQLGKVKLISWLKPLRWVADNSSAKFDYSRTVEQLEKLRTDTTGGWTRDAEDVSNRLGASARFGQRFKSGWNISLDYSWSKTLSTREQFAIDQYSASRQYATAWGFSTDYSLRAPTGVRFPILRGLRLKSTLNLKLTVRLTTNKSETANARDGKYTISQHRTSLEISPLATYSFSSNMKGGFQMNWRDQTDKAQHPARTSYTRQVSFWVEFTF